MKRQPKAFLKTYQAYLKQQKLKLTKQRALIVQEFARVGKHISAEALFKVVKGRDSSIGLASIYRTLNSLVEAGLALERHFLDRTTVYEMHQAGLHHDHLICMRCHKIFEFENTKIEALQDEVAKKLGFSLLEHRLELYGICQRANCPNL